MKKILILILLLYSWFWCTIAVPDQGIIIKKEYLKGGAYQSKSSSMYIVVYDRYELKILWLGGIAKLSCDKEEFSKIKIWDTYEANHPLSWDTNWMP